ncbi:relaxase/mobilization nuclease domain-containing protein, partial [Hymenobacter algoricola]|uniref:relaxase/mobilization nuclease domain-containing protein n=1 Tax=Hymenobacter algoricola TaxID=486267 RepID=UPI0031E85602
MIGKVKIGKSFGGICRYVFGEEKGAEVLATEGVRGTSAEHMAADFNAQRELNPNLGKAVMHVALAWPAEEKAQLPNERIEEIARAYLKAMKVDPEGTQWALVRHKDQDHPHAHLIVNRVDNAGATVSDQHNYRHSLEACRQLEKQYGLVSAQEVSQDNRRAEREQLPERAAAKLYVQDALSRHLPHATSTEELTAALQRDGIGVQATYQKEKLQAVVFEYEGQHLKGSELGRAYSGNNLAKTIEVQQQRAELSTGGQQYGQHRLELELEAFGREYAAQKEQAEKQAQERTTPQQTPKRQQPTIKRSGGYEMG